MRSQDIIMLLFSIMFIFIISSSATPITAPTIPTYFLINNDDSSSNIEGTVWFEYTPADTGVHCVTIKSTWGDPIFTYYDTSDFGSSQKYLKSWSFSDPYTSYSHDTWVYLFEVDEVNGKPHRMLVRRGAPGVILNGFEFYVCKGNEILISKTFEDSVIEDTTIYSPTHTKIYVNNVTVPDDYKFSNWSVISGTVNITDTARISTFMDVGSNCELKMNLVEQEIYTIRPGKNELPISVYGATGFPSDGYKLRLIAPDSGTYAYKTNVMVGVNTSISNPIIAFSETGMTNTWPNSTYYFKDQVDSSIFVGILDWRNDLETEGDSFSIEIGHASLIVNIDTTEHIDVTFSDRSSLTVPGWVKSLRCSLDVDYRLDSFSIIEGTGTAGITSLTAQTDLTVKANVSKRYKYPILPEWKVFDRVCDRWNKFTGTYNDVYLTFTAPETDSFTITAFWIDSSSYGSLSFYNEVYDFKYYPLVQSDVQITYTFNAVADSTMTFLFSLPTDTVNGYNKFAIIGLQHQAAIPEKPNLTDQVKISSNALNVQGKMAIRISNGVIKIGDVSQLCKVECYMLNGRQIPLTLEYGNDKTLYVKTLNQLSSGLYLLRIQDPLSRIKKELKIISTDGRFTSSNIISHCK